MSGNTQFDQHTNFVIFLEGNVSVELPQTSLNVGTTLCIKGWRVAVVPNWYVFIVFVVTFHVFQGIICCCV